MDKPGLILEVCFGSSAGLMAAMNGGADLIELCPCLKQVGLTPLAGLMQAVAQTEIPCHAMILPHAGDFYYDPHCIGWITR